MRGARRTSLRLAAATAIAVGGGLANLAGCGLDAVATGSGPLPAEASLGEVSVDASQVATMAPDAPDGPTEVPIGTPNFCAGQPWPFVACWDFDAVPPGGDAGFAEAINAGTLDIIDEQGNHALRFTLPSAVGSRSSWVRYNLPAIGTAQATYELAFRFSIRSSSLDYAVIGAFLVGPAVHTVGVASYNRGSRLAGIPRSEQEDSIHTAPGPAWHAVQIQMTGNGASMREKVVIDGVGVGERTFAGGASGLDLRLGTFFTSAQPQGGIEVVIDDIVVRVQ